MTRAEIYELALQCRVWIPLASGPEREQTIDRLLRLAALVASAEREACAQLAVATPRREQPPIPKSLLAAQHDIQRPPE